VMKLFPGKKQNFLSWDYSPPDYHYFWILWCQNKGILLCMEFSKQKLWIISLHNRFICHLYINQLWHSWNITTINQDYVGKEECFLQCKHL
jgi:hypothetical protein